MTSRRCGFLGAGRMACALAEGFLRAGLTTPESLLATDPSIEAGERFQKLTGGRIVENRALAGEVDLIFLAVKPQHMADAMRDLRGQMSERHLIVSVAAGVTLATMQEGLGPKPRLVRVMPNTPCLVGEGACAYSLGPNATDDDAQAIDTLLASVGRVLRVEEKLLDAVTGLSGSGPAYACLMIEALADGGVQMGLPRATALTLAAQTLLGAARMILTTGEHPGALKDAVASPGGTTIAGLAALEAGGVRAALMSAVAAATRRSQELGRPGG